MLQITEREGAIAFAVRVQPRASRDEVAGEMGGALKVRLQAPAIEGRANQALIEFLSSVLKRPRAAVRISSGEGSRVKRVEVTGVTKNDILGLLTQEA